MINDNSAEHWYNFQWLLIKRNITNMVLELYPDLYENDIDSHVEAAMSVLESGLLASHDLRSSGMLSNDFHFMYSLAEQRGAIINKPELDPYSLITKMS